MKNIYFVAILSGLLFSGCSVMHFKNGSVEAAGTPKTAWHHNGIYSLVEFSPILEPKKLCPEKNWSMITTKLTFVTGLVGSVDNIVLGAVLPMVPIDIWSPQDVEWYCATAGSAASISPAPADSVK
jgi:hypothetical protein